MRSLLAWLFGALCAALWLILLQTTHFSSMAVGAGLLGMVWVTGHARGL